MHIHFYSAISFKETMQLNYYPEIFFSRYIEEKEHYIVDAKLTYTKHLVDTISKINEDNLLLYPADLNIKRANEYIPYLELLLIRLNDYKELRDFVMEILKTCNKYPDNFVMIYQ